MAELAKERAEVMLCRRHCRVAKHGRAFEGVLRSKNANQPGWGFLVADGSDASNYYRLRVEYDLSMV